MANEIIIGDISNTQFRVGSADCRIYLGDTLLYPHSEPFQGKWKATYSDSHIETAACDSTSAITYNEISGTDLVSLEIGSCVTSIGDSAFEEYESLSSITIPNSVASIGAGAFFSCINLTDIVIPNSVASIGGGAFETCDLLASVNIPSGVTTIGDNTFRYCGSLTGITIPASVTTIGEGAFKYCSSMETLTIGSGVTSIGEDAFRYNTSLTGITIYAVTPPTIISSFDNTGSCPIYVPSGSVSTYQSSWPSLASRIQAIPEPTPPTPPTPPSPSGYTEVEYLENVSPNLAYINTNFAPNENTRVIADLQYVTSSLHPRAFGCGKWNSVGYIFNAENGITSSGVWKWKFGSNNNDWIPTGVATDFNRHTVEINNGVLYIDNVQITSTTVSTFQLNDNLGFFGSIYNGTLDGTSVGENMFGKFYSFKIYDNGTLIRDFVPMVRNSDSKAGMYDTVNDVFYLSPNGAEFVAGSPV